MVTKKIPDLAEPTEMEQIESMIEWYVSKAPRHVKSKTPEDVQKMLDRMYNVGLLTLDQIELYKKEKNI